MFARMVLVLAVAGCPTTTTDTTGSDTGCATDAECGGGGLVCVGPQSGDLGCGVPPLEECNTSKDCGADEVCHAFNDSCSADGFGSVCASPCTADGDCGSGLRCDEGTCTVISCADEPTCPGWEFCDASGSATGVLGQNDGCAVIPCADDAVCGTGRCVVGVCQSGLGTCGNPPLPPP